MGTKDFNFLDIIIADLRLKKIAHYLNSDDIVLDFGCGNQAFFLRHVRKKIKKGIGIDYDVENDKIGSIELIKFKFENKIPFENNYFDKICILAVLEHLEIEKIEILFREFKRVIKPGGKIIMTTPT